MNDFNAWFKNWWFKQVCSSDQETQKWLQEQPWLKLTIELMAKSIWDELNVQLS